MADRQLWVRLEGCEQSVLCFVAFDAYLAG